MPETFLVHILCETIHLRCEILYQCMLIYEVYCGMYRIYNGGGLFTSRGPLVLKTEFGCRFGYQNWNDSQFAL